MKENLLMKAAMQFAPKRWSSEPAMETGNRRKFKQTYPDHYMRVVAQCETCLQTEQVVYNNIWDIYAGKFRLQLVDVLNESSPERMHLVKIKVCQHCIPVIEQYALSLGL